MIGLERGTVRVVAYQSEWARLFDEERRLIEVAIGLRARGIEHVGSTAVEGLVAKPIIDITVAVAEVADVAACVEPLASLGYEFKGEDEIPEHFLFGKGVPLRTHHLHMVGLDSEFWRDHLLFRDYLRRNRETADEYARLKLQLAAQFAHEREAYTQAKSPFIKRVLEAAKAR
jgi:GrpB-like predicted nucleotidyltransferase (UPF0157 family)